MGKRLLRIFQKDISSRLNQLLKKEVNIVFMSKVTLHGVIIKSEQEVLFVNDMLHRKHEFRINTIAEIHLDQEAPF